MLREIMGVSQMEEGRTRRWFHDDYFDLFTWQDPGGDLVSFQLCYGIGGNEKALVWKKELGYFVDGAEAEAPKPGRASSSGGGTGAEPETDVVAKRFEVSAQNLPSEVREFIAGSIRNFPELVPANRPRRRRFRREAWQQKPPGAN
jgi:hypothetical protein